MRQRHAMPNAGRPQAFPLQQPVNNGPGRQAQSHRQPRRDFLKQPLLAGSGRQYTYCFGLQYARKLHDHAPWRCPGMCRGPPLLFLPVTDQSSRYCRHRDGTRHSIRPCFRSGTPAPGRRPSSICITASPTLSDGIFGFHLSHNHRLQRLGFSAADSDSSEARI